MPICKLLLFGILLASALPAQITPADTLARQLASRQERETALERVRQEGRHLLPILLELSRREPRGTEVGELLIGLADAFGILRAEEGIPFLIANISLHRHFHTPNIWLKERTIIRAELPCVSALIRVGPATTEPLKLAYNSLTPDDQLAAVFVASEIGDRNAIRFLRYVVAQAKEQITWGEQGLARIQNRSRPERIEGESG